MEADPPLEENYKSLFGNLMDQGNLRRVYDKREKSPLIDNEFELPIVDLSRLRVGGPDSDRDECKREVARAACRLGIFQVVNHDIPGEILARMQSEQQKLFRQPFQKKANDKFLDLSTEYYGWGNPSATSLNQFSWSEAFHLPLNNIHLLNTTLSTTIAEFAEKVSDLAQRISEILEENYLGYKSTFFARNCQPGSCYLRMNRYPPCPISTENICGLVPHTDTDFLTILNQDQVGGLEMVKDGKWVSIKPNLQALVINIGDLFQAWSNGVYKSVEHRVITNHKVERFSVAYFMCPSNDTIIQSSCTEPSLYRKFSFSEYKQQVLEDVKSTGSKVGLQRFLM